MTRWQPDTCDGFAEGLGCIIDVVDWGPNGDTPNGVHVRRCPKHGTLHEAHSENIRVSKEKNKPDAAPRG